jgi:hypothetical protein
LIPWSLGAPGPDKIKFALYGVRYNVNAVDDLSHRGMGVLRLALRNRAPADAL